MKIYILAGVSVILITAAILLRIALKQSRLQEKLVRRVRTTDLYGHVYPLLKKFDSDMLDTVVFRPECIIIRMLEPLGAENRYTYKKHGLDDPTGEALYAIAQAALVDMKHLRNGKHYEFKIHESLDRNDNPYTWYEYVIVPKWKASILRAEQKKRLAARTF